MFRSIAYGIFRVVCMRSALSRLGREQESIGALTFGSLRSWCIYGSSTILKGENMAPKCEGVFDRLCEWILNQYFQGVLVGET